jgi:hypothetical protein
MISQYKQEEEEQNRYVDPASGAEFRYAPAGTAPILSISTLVDVPSLGAPAPVADLRKEKANFVKIYENFNDAKQEIEDKSKEGKKKQKEKAGKEAQVIELKSQRAKIDKLKKKRFFFKRCNKKINNSQKKFNTNSRRIGRNYSSKCYYSRIKQKIAEFIKNQTDLEAIYNPIETTAMRCAARGLVAVAGAGDAMLLTMVLWVGFFFYTS